VTDQNSQKNVSQLGKLEKAYEYTENNATGMLLSERCVCVYIDKKKKKSNEKHSGKDTV
jgi:hypothetical protein